MKKKIKKLLLIYYRTERADASTITEHLHSFKKYSTFDITEFNTFYSDKIPHDLNEFDVILVHYCMFGSLPFKLWEPALQQVENNTSAVKVAFFQDEHQFCPQRFEIIRRAGITTIFSLVKPKDHYQVYGKNTGVQDIVHTLTGYVDDKLVELAPKYLEKYTRTIDVGYRARKLNFYLGEGAQDKYLIAEKFQASQFTKGLKLDISTQESDRLYGEKWYQFLASSRCSLGIESGASVFDLRDEVKPLVRKVFAENPEADFEEVQQKALLPFENKINYLMVAPRLFECAVFKVCLVCFEGEYQNIFHADKHYIPLRKDFSNIQDVVRQIMDPVTVKRITDQAYEDLIASKKYHYRKFIAEFDAHINRVYFDESEGKTACAV